MSEQSSSAFVPFVPAGAARVPASPVASLKVLPKSEGGPVFEPLQTGCSHAQGTGQSVVTLQREGERVSGIRIECACGQVVELACSY